MSSTNHKYIILYSDEFKYDIWVSYMQILNLPPQTKQVKLMIQDVIAYDIVI